MSSVLFEGINKKLVGMLLERSKYIDLLDDIQLMSPPFNQMDLSERIGIPQSTISKFFQRLESIGVRIRTDYNIKRLGLISHVVLLRNAWIDRVILEGPLMAVTYMANTLSGSILICRYPVSEARLSQAIHSYLKYYYGVKPDSLKAMYITYQAMSKPRLGHYINESMRRGYGSLNPLNALKVNDTHPRPHGIIGEIDSSYFGRFRDVIDLVIISALDRSAINYIRYAVEELQVIRRGNQQKYVRSHFSHVAPALNGTKVMAYDKNNLLVSILGLTSKRCSIDLIEEMYTYIYSTSLGYSNFKDSEFNIMISASLPANYAVKFVNYMYYRCGWDEFHSALSSLDDIIKRYSISYKLISYTSTGKPIFDFIDLERTYFRKARASRMEYKIEK